MYKKGELFRKMLDKRTAGLSSMGMDFWMQILIVWDAMRLWMKDITTPNNKGSVTYRYLLREKLL